MVKWLSGLFDTTDKELNRLRRIVAEANEEIVALLESERDNVTAIREQVFKRLSGKAAGWWEIQAREMAGVASEARRLAGQADTLRSVIEQGEQTSRELSVLLADSRQLSTMNAEKNQRPPAERLSSELGNLASEAQAGPSERGGDRQAMVIDPGLFHRALEGGIKALSMANYFEVKG